MSNTATALYTIPAREGKPGPIRAYKIAIDTVDTDLTIYTPTTGNRVYVVGMLLSETDATNITFKSGSTTITALEAAANQGIYDKVGEGFVFATNTDEALKIQASVAISNLLIHVVDADRY